MVIHLRVLIVEDSPDDAELLALRLQSEGFDLDWERVEHENDYLAALARRPDIIMADWSLPRFSGMRALELMREHDLDIPFIIVSGSVGEEAAVEAMRQGAQDYVLKDRPTRLGQAVRRALEEQRLRVERSQTLDALQASERRYRTLFENVSEVVFGLSPHGAITLLNPYFERATGWPVGEWIGRPFLELIQPDDRPRALDAWQRTLDGELIGDIELRARTSSGGPLVFNIVVAGRVEDDTQVGLIGFAHDVTAKVLAEEETFRRFAELEVLHRAGQRLLDAALDPEETYIAAHEAVAALVPCEAFVITMVDGSEDVHHAVYLADRDGRWPAQAVPLTGLSGYVIARGETVQIDDLETQTEFAVLAYGSGRTVRSALAVPFRNEGRVVGMMAAESYELATYNARHRLLLETVAAQFAATIRNAYLFQEEQTRLHEMELVASVSAALRTQPTRASMPGVILDQLLKLLSVEGATLEILDPASGDLIVELGRGIWESMTGQRIPAGQGLAASVLATGKPYLNNEARADEALYAPALFGDCRAAAGVPMVADQEIIGLLWIGSRRMLKDHDMRALTAVADIAANAIRRATLHERVQAQQLRVTRILESVPEGVLLLDALGTVLLANPAAESALVALVGAPVPGRLTHLGERSLASLLTPDPEGLWHEVTVADRTFEIVSRSIPGETEDTLWVLVVQDVTQERQIRQQQQRQERLAAVGQLAAGMAHDFNNILAVIVLYAHMAQRSVEATHPVQRWMSIIQDQSSQATDLIQQMLDFSRRGDVQREPLDLLALLDQQARLLQRTLPENITVTFDTIADASYAILGDATRIQQVVTNLAVNARDAMPEGGRLRISLAPLPLRPGAVLPLPEMDPGEWIRLAITDTGTGMPPEVREHLFEPFFTTKPPGKGTGLGLAQAYGIVAQHDGHIDVRTRMGRGTTFSIYLPALSTATHEGSSSDDVDEVPRGRGERILVVEDNATLRAALVLTLADLGYSVVEAADGEAALAQIASNGDPIALVLSDVVMPRMGGVALLRALRAQGSEVPFILLTGHAMDQDRDDLWEEGLSAWLNKPPQLGELAVALDKALRSRNN